MKNKSKTKQITYTLVVTVVALVGLLIITRGITYAKYVSNSVLNYYLNSKGFYFRSESLDIETKSNVDTSWDGGKVTFSINNSSNKSLATEYDIKYEITCSIEETDTTKVCYLNGTNSSKVTQTLSADFACKDTANNTDVSSLDETQCKKQGYTWTAIPSTSVNYFEVVDINGKDVDTANVIITATTTTSPYKKTIKGKYTLNKDKSELGTLSVKYETKTHYENVIVINSYNEDKCVKLKIGGNKMTKVLTIIKKVILTIVGVAYFIFALAMTILLLNYNNYGVTQFGSKSLIIINDQIANEKYMKGDLVIVNLPKLENMKPGDEMFCYRIDSKGIPSLQIGTIGEVYVEENAISYENGETYSYEFIAGKTEEIHAGVGTFLSVVESKWGFLFIVLVPCFLIFIYELYSLIIEIKYGAEED